SKYSDSNGRILVIFKKSLSLRRRSAPASIAIWAIQQSIELFMFTPFRLSSKYILAASAQVSSEASR
ncbi:MAG: hypothetical protein LWX54_17115, partial [Deltaproteobacteria bacterium]|nr:hypothetical protein [Deltaproteobacteria bacterium]